MDKTPEILFVPSGQRYSKDAARYFGEVACGKLDAFGFVYKHKGEEQFIPVVTTSQGQSERSLTWLGPRLSRSFLKNVKNQIRQVREEAGIDSQGSLELGWKLTPEEAKEYAEHIEQALDEHSKAVPQQTQLENNCVS